MCNRKRMRVLNTLAVALLLASVFLLGNAASAQNLVCPPPLKAMMRAELFFGRNIGGELGVSDRQWTQFVARELTPRFPNGLTVIDGKGQWRGDSTIMRETSKIVIVVLTDTADAHDRLAAVTAAYKKHFAQKSVGFVTQPVCAAF